MAYAAFHLSGLLFAVLLLAPDLSALGYLINNRWGAISYNLAHLMALPIVLLIIGAAASNELLLSIALIWLAHIGMDRAVGYGLKYPSGFRDNHLSRV